MKGKAMKRVLTGIIMFGTFLSAQVDIGSDLVSRYVWRGTDFGNSASVQPYLSYSFASLEVGAWASYPLTNDAIGSNENDLYIGYSLGDLGLTLTDYYFPETANFSDYSSDGGFHILEFSASYAVGPVSALAAFNFSGDSDNSLYIELGYEILADENGALGCVLGLGNGAYSSDTEFSAVNLALTASRGDYSASYIINPDADTNYLVFAYSLTIP